MKKLSYFYSLAIPVLFISCGQDDPPPVENEEEIISEVSLTFTPQSGGTPFTATATDPDGEGPQDLQITDFIQLTAQTVYTMNIELENSIAGESITEEVEEEGDEHQFFFQWSSDIFSDPMGNGNADNRDDPVAYLDTDDNGLPLGLSTEWTTGNGTAGSLFRIVLKHQPGSKSSTSDINTGDTDVDLTWTIIIQ